jgi:basic amino acid/polyamine antiporter, APA family
MSSVSTPESQPKLVRAVGLFDATMLVMGGIVGSGIFMNPYVVARQVHTPLLIVGAWAAGGVIALLGAFVYAELAARMPDVGGQYAYLRSAYHPALGFLYGWVLLLVIQTGGMAAVTVTFANYFLALWPMPVPPKVLALITLAVLTVINCFGVKLGARVQSGLMLARIAAIAAVVVAGLFLIRTPHAIARPVLDRPPSFDLLTAFGAAMVPVLFAYGGWQTSNFVAAEIREPRRNLARALLIGVTGVVILYIAVNVACVRALGPAGLAATERPATAVMDVALGPRGVSLIAFGIALSTVGFLSQSVLTAPRVYFAMAEDGLFFRAIAAVHPRTHVPVAAIVLQSVWTAVIALWLDYARILSYVIAMDALFWGLTATCIFVFRRRARGARDGGFRVPGHPWTTLIFVIAAWSVAAASIYKYPQNTLIGVAILALGVPVYWLWQRRRQVA